MALCLRIDGSTYGDGKDCYAVVSDCRRSEGYRIRVVIGPLIDSHQLPVEDKRAHGVEYVQTTGFDVVDYLSIDHGGQLPEGYPAPVASLATVSVWELSRQAAEKWKLTAMPSDQV
jgi:hypothetical protein